MYRQIKIIVITEALNIIIHYVFKNKYVLLKMVGIQFQYCGIGLKIFQTMSNVVVYNHKTENLK